MLLQQNLFTAPVKQHLSEKSITINPFLGCDLWIPAICDLSKDSSERFGPGKRKMLYTLRSNWIFQVQPKHLLSTNCCTLIFQRLDIAKCPGISEGQPSAEGIMLSLTVLPATLKSSACRGKKSKVSKCLGETAKNNDLWSSFHGVDQVPNCIPRTRYLKRLRLQGSYFNDCRYLFSLSAKILEQMYLLFSC